MVTADPREVADSHGQAADSRKVAKPVSERESLEHEHEQGRPPHRDGPGRAALTCHALCPRQAYVKVGRFRCSSLYTQS